MQMAEPHRIVVGIDFGTTYSAVAWAESTRPDQIELIKNWPTSGQLVGSQAPTEIAYQQGDTTSFSWGYDINPRARKIKWFKLSLETDNDVLSLPEGLTAIDVATDYFTALYKHIMTTLYRRFDANAMQRTRVDFVLTVPAIWSDGAKKKTEDAAIRAGMGNEHGLELLSEPESAAIYTLKNIDSTNSQVSVGDRIVVCDAGGGTVDLISYEVRQIHPQLSVAECTAGTGDYCGSTFIDQEFETLFAARMGTAYGNLSPNHRQQVVKNFELAKMAFRNDLAKPTFFVNVPTVGDLPDAGIFGGEFELTREEMVQLFEGVVAQVIKLVSAQVQAVSSDPHRANAILLVGGFGESEYLFQRLRDWAIPYGIQVIQPREAATAIVRGAVIKGLEPKTGPEMTEIVRRARRSYGVPTYLAFIPGKHMEVDLHVDSETGERLAKNQISWFIRKNQPLTDSQTFRHAFRRNFSRLTPWHDVLVSSSWDNPPSRWDPTPNPNQSAHSHLHRQSAPPGSLGSSAHHPGNIPNTSLGVDKHCTITSDLTTVNKSLRSEVFERRWRKFRRYYTANYELVMGVKNSNLTVWLEFQGRRFGVASVEFE